MNKLFSRLMPFITLGIAIVAFTFGLVLLAYLFLFGALVGGILFIFSWLRDKYFPKSQPTRRPEKREGRVIDSDDWHVH